MRRRLPAPVWVLALATTAALAGCGASRPSLSDPQIERWLTAVQSFSDQPRLSSLCFLLTRAQLTHDISHPPSPWSVEGFNDQTQDFRRFVGCRVRSDAGGDSGDGELGLVHHDPSGRDNVDATRTVAIPGSHWDLFYLAWPGRQQGSAAELHRVTADVVRNLSAPPPPSPSPPTYAGPNSGL